MFIYQKSEKYATCYLLTCKCCDRALCARRVIYKQGSRKFGATVTKSNLFFKILHYLWVGYGSYLAIPLSFITTLVAIYYLAIDNIPAFKSVFSHFWLFLVVALAVGIPVTCVVGWLHVTRNSKLQSAKDVSVEASTDHYRREPEYWQDAVAPIYVELLRGVGRILDRDGMLDSDDKRRIQELEAKLQALIDSKKLGSSQTEIKA